MAVIGSSEACVEDHRDSKYLQSLCGEMHIETRNA